METTIAELKPELLTSPEAMPRSIKTIENGYRKDALCQIFRVHKLIQEVIDLENRPEDLQVRSIALSMEYALERIGNYFKTKDLVEA